MLLPGPPKNIDTGPTDQYIIARAAGQCVVPCTSNQDVAAVAAIRIERNACFKSGPQDDVIAGPARGVRERANRCRLLQCAGFLPKSARDFGRTPLLVYAKA